MEHSHQINKDIDTLFEMKRGYDHTINQLIEQAEIDPHCEYQAHKLVEIRKLIDTALGDLIDYKYKHLA